MFVAFLVGTFLFLFTPRVKAETKMSTLPIEKMGTVEMVNISQLGRNAHQFSFMQDNEGNYRTVILSGKGRVVEFTEKSAFAIAEGRRTPLITETTKDGAILPQWTEGIVFKEGEVFAPASFVQNVFELTERNGEIVFEKAKPKTTKTQEEESEEIFFKTNETNTKTKNSQESPTITPEVVNEVPEEKVEEVVEEEPVVDEVETDEVEKPEVQLPEAPQPPNIPVEKENIIENKDWEALYQQINQLDDGLSIRFGEQEILIEVMHESDKSEQRKSKLNDWLTQQNVTFSIEETHERTHFIIKRSL